MTDEGTTSPVPPVVDTYSSTDEGHSTRRRHAAGHIGPSWCPDCETPPWSARLDPVIKFGIVAHGVIGRPGRRGLVPDPLWPTRAAHPLALLDAVNSGGAVGWVPARSGLLVLDVDRGRDRLDEVTDRLGPPAGSYDSAGPNDGVHLVYSARPVPPEVLRRRLTWQLPEEIEDAAHTVGGDLVGTRATGLAWARTPDAVAAVLDLHLRPGPLPAPHPDLWEGGWLQRSDTGSNTGARVFAAVRETLSHGGHPPRSTPTEWATMRAHTGDLVRLEAAARSVRLTTTQMARMADRAARMCTCSPCQTWRSRRAVEVRTEAARSRAATADKMAAEGRTRAEIASTLRLSPVTAAGPGRAVSVLTREPPIERDSGLVDSAVAASPLLADGLR